MTKREAAIVSAYTGFLCGSFDAFHEYVEEIMERPVWTHEMGDSETFKEIQKRAKKDFISFRVTDD